MLTAVIVMASCKSDGTMKQAGVENPINADGTVDETKLPKFEFEHDTYDFGKISEGEKVSYSFKFKNVGKTALVISNASASCGCTVPSWPEEPIPPGGEGKVEVVFDSKGKLGMQNKTITLVSNTIPNTKVLYLRGEILEVK